MNLNNVTLCGRLTKAPELKQTPTGQSVATFSMATNRVWLDKTGSKQEAADYHNLVVWGKLAETSSKFLEKGQVALIQGRIQTRSYEKDGTKKYVTEIIAEKIQFGQKANGGGKGLSGLPARELEQTSEELPPNNEPADLPF